MMVIWTLAGIGCLISVLVALFGPYDDGRRVDVLLEGLLFFSLPFAAFAIVCHVIRWIWMGRKVD